MGLRELLILILILAIVGIILRGLYVALRARRGQLRVHLDKNIPQYDPEELSLSELPNGGARMVERSFAQVVQQNSEFTAKDRRKTGKSEHAIPVLMDTIGDDDEDDDEALSTPRQSSVASARDAARHKHLRGQRAAPVVQKPVHRPIDRMAALAQNNPISTSTPRILEESHDGDDDTDDDFYDDPLDSHVFSKSDERDDERDFDETEDFEDDADEDDFDSDDDFNEDQRDDDRVQDDSRHEDPDQDDLDEDEFDASPAENSLDPDDDYDTEEEDFDDDDLDKEDVEEGDDEDFEDTLENAQDDDSDYDDQDDQDDDVYEKKAYDDLESWEDEDDAEDAEDEEESLEAEEFDAVYNDPEDDDAPSAEQDADEFDDEDYEQDELDAAAQEAEKSGPRGWLKWAGDKLSGKASGHDEPVRERDFHASDRAEPVLDLDALDEEISPARPSKPAPAPRSSKEPLDKSRQAQLTFEDDEDELAEHADEHKNFDDEPEQAPMHAEEVQLKATNAEASVPQEYSEVLVVNVMAKPEREFYGVDLLQALLASGLRFGDMSIFHRHFDQDPSSPVLFSVANMVNPGTFDLNQINDFATRGVCFFMTLPNVANSMQAFERMLDAAQQLRIALDGDLKDDNRSVMTAQTIEHYRQRVRDFDLRQLRQQK